MQDQSGSCSGQARCCACMACRRLFEDPCFCAVDWISTICMAIFATCRTYTTGRYSGSGVTRPFLHVRQPHCVRRYCLRPALPSDDALIDFKKMLERIEIHLCGAKQHKKLHSMESRQAIWQKSSRKQQQSATKLSVHYGVNDIL